MIADRQTHTHRHTQTRSPQYSALRYRGRSNNISVSDARKATFARSRPQDPEDSNTDKRQPASSKFTASPLTSALADMDEMKTLMTAAGVAASADIAHSRIDAKHDE